MRPRYLFVFWFPILATTLLVAFLAVASRTPVQPGPGALTGLANIPNYVILLLCALIAGACIIARPKPLFPSWRIVVGTLLGYSAFLAAFATVPTLRGFYTLKIQVVDWNHNPVSNVFVQISTARPASLSVGALVPAIEVQLMTDERGMVMQGLSRFSEVFGQINPPWKQPRTVGFRAAEFHIIPQKNGRYTIVYEWSNRLFDEGTNPRFHTTEDAQLRGLTLTVFLPYQNGDDTDPYSGPHA